MKTSRNIVKNSSSKGMSKNAGKSSRGSENKSIRDGASAKARTGKTAPTDFGGEVIIDGKLTAAQKAEILAIARNTGKTGPRDAERVTKIAEKGSKLVITTSGNELAVSIGKRVHHSHKGGKLTIVWGHEESPVRVTWVQKA